VGQTSPGQGLVADDRDARFERDGVDGGDDVWIEGTKVRPRAVGTFKDGSSVFEFTPATRHSKLDWL